MTEKRKRSCPAATGTGQDLNKISFYDIIKELKNQPKKELFKDIFGCFLMFMSCIAIGFLLLLIGGC